MQSTGFASIGIGIDNKFQSVKSNQKSPLIGIFPNRGEMDHGFASYASPSDATSIGIGTNDYSITALKNVSATAFTLKVAVTVCVTKSVVGAMWKRGSPVPKPMDSSAIG